MTIDIQKLQDGQAAEIERLRDDAARYQWLRDNPAVACAVSGAIRSIFKLRTPGAGLDAAVDAGIAAERGTRVAESKA